MSMAIYYFDVIAANGVILRDDVGVNLPDLAAAEREAREDAAAIAFEQGHSALPTLLRVRDELREVFTITVQMLATISRSGLPLPRPSS